MRIIASTAGIAIDEIEVRGVPEPGAATMMLGAVVGGLSLLVRRRAARGKAR